MSQHLKFHRAASTLAFSLTLMASLQVMAIGGPSGTKIDYKIEGQIGRVVMNPYGIAPLTAVIRNGGYVIEKATVRIVPKNSNSYDLKYDVSRKQLLTHAGIPVFGLYPDHVNKVEVSYVRNDNGKKENISETYTVYAPPVLTETAGTSMENSALFETEVRKMAPEFRDRMYFINNLSLDKSGSGTRAVWNNPTGGALEWNFNPKNAIIDSAGDVRWYMLSNPIYDANTLYRGGVMMGFQQTADGAMTWGYGQRYVKYDIMGREIFNRRLPENYNDFSHALDNMQNGHFLMRVASSDYKRPDGKHVRTVRDVIVELDRDGQVIDEWRLFDILDPYRDNVLKVLDQGAVCLNVDASKAGQTLSAEELAKLDSSDKFGDIVGSSAGRNWAHVNSVDYDPTDDSIIISSRHQSALIKIGRDKKVKWILGSPEGWKKGWIEKVLIPVDSKGRKIACEGSKCEGSFDWSWTQHTGWRIDSKSDKRNLYLSVFDNGDARGMEQPAMASMKYSRAVIYKIDQKKQTVEQIWEYGKERGVDWYSPVTSLTQYQADKNSVFVYSATAGANFDLKVGRFTSGANPFLEEFRWGETEPAVEIQLKNTQGYQAIPFSVTKAFSQ